MNAISLPPPLRRPLVIGVVCGLHVAGLALLASGMQAASPAPALALLQVALIEDRPAAGPSAVPEARPVHALPRPTRPARQAVPVQARRPAPAVDQAVPGTPMGASMGASMGTSTRTADDTPAASAAAATNAPAVPAAATAGAGTSPVTAARFDADYLNNPPPAYPALSRRLGEAGEVRLKVRVSATGLPARIELAHSSGSERLDRAARDAVARWRFIPARQGEHDVEDWVLVPIIFRLQDK